MPCTQACLAALVVAPLLLVARVRDAEAERGQREGGGRDDARRGQDLHGSPPSSCSPCGGTCLLPVRREWHLLLSEEARLLDGDHDLADVPGALQVAERLARLVEREHAVDHRPAGRSPAIAPVHVLEHRPRADEDPLDAQRPSSAPDRVDLRSRPVSTPIRETVPAAPRRLERLRQRARRRRPRPRGPRPSPPVSSTTRSVPVRASSRS